jgi:Polyketide cyclase / dehydrase and lipid transport
MASIHHEIAVEVGAEQAWAALRTVGAAHKLFAPVLVDGELKGDTRKVRFANGMEVRERLLDIDDSRRRVAYTVLDGPGMSYHHASMQVVEAGPRHCRFVWITDFLPQDIGGNLMPLIEAGSTALKKNLEAAKP